MLKIKYKPTNCYKGQVMADRKIYKYNSMGFGERRIIANIVYLLCITGNALYSFVIVFTITLKVM